MGLLRAFHVEQIGGFVPRLDLTAKPEKGVKPAKGKEGKNDDGHGVLRYYGSPTIKHLLYSVKGFVVQAVTQC